MENLDVAQFRTELTSQNFSLQTRSLLPWRHLRASHSRSTSSTGRWRRRDGAPLNPARMLALLWLKRSSNFGMLSVSLHRASSGSCTVGAQQLGPATPVLPIQDDEDLWSNWKTQSPSSDWRTKRGKKWPSLPSVKPTMEGGTKSGRAELQRRCSLLSSTASSPSTWWRTFCTRVQMPQVRPCAIGGHMRAPPLLPTHHL